MTPAGFDIREHVVETDNVGITTADIAEVIPMRPLLHVAAARLRHDHAKAVRESVNDRRADAA
jgi:hypothetical protein